MNMSVIHEILGLEIFYHKSLTKNNKIVKIFDNRTRHASRRSVPRRVIFLGECTMQEQLKTHQPPMSIDEQIDNLKDKTK